MKFSLGRVVLALGLVLILGAGGCESFNRMWGSPAGTEVAQTHSRAPAGPAPAYSAVAQQYDSTIARLGRLYARANIRVSYYDEHGELQTEDPEGQLQVVRPNRLLLSLGKAGKTLFLFGCDAERYWWFDLTDADKSFAAVGRHDLFNEETSRRIGLPLRPLDLIRVLAVTPLDPKAPGATQWSNDGTQIGITTMTESGGYQRLWLDRNSLLPVSMELFGPRPGRKLLLTADYEGTERVDLYDGSRRPLVRSRIYINDLVSKTKARMTLTGLRDHGVTDKAFDFDVLRKNFPVAQVIDLDRERK